MAWHLNSHSSERTSSRVDKMSGTISHLKSFNLTQSGKKELKKMSNRKRRFFLKFQNDKF